MNAAAFAKFNKVPAESRYTKIGQRFNKTPQWAMVFCYYLLSNVLFWLASVIMLVVS